MLVAADGEVVEEEVPAAAAVGFAAVVVVALASSPVVVLPVPVVDVNEGFCCPESVAFVDATGGAGEEEDEG